jgi:butyrate kinase
MVNGQARVCEDLEHAMLNHCELDHASNLGIPIAARLAVCYNVPAFSVDPVVSDDFCEEARFSGYAPIERRSIAHALSVKRLAIKAARQLERPVEELNLVVVHLGGGITVAAVKGGRLIDNNIALLGSGPFTPQRVGSLPMKALIDLCYGGRFTRQELETELTRNGGWKSYLGTDSGLELERRLAAGDPKTRQVLEAMAYQIAKEIGAMAIAAGLPLDALVFSGGLTRFTPLLDMILRRAGPLCATRFFYPDSVEMEAMAGGVLAVLEGKTQARRFQLPAHLRS